MMLSKRVSPEEVAGPAAELASRLALADTEAEIWTAVSAFVSGHLGASHTLVLERHTGAPREGWTYSPVFVPAGAESVQAFASSTELTGMGLVVAPPPAAAGGAFDAAFRAVPEAGAGGLVHADVGATHLILAVYRWASPVLTHRDWSLLDAVARVTASALRRVEMVLDPGNATQPS